MHADDALDELRAGAGTQFDPAVVDAFCEAVADAGPRSRTASSGPAATVGSRPPPP